VLTHGRSGGVLCGLLLCCVLGGAHAQEVDEEQSLKRPQRLTSSAGDQFLGQLARNGREISFLSNRNTTTEPFVQDLEEGRARRLFDEGADITWPRRSPQDHALLYISYRDRADGQLCVRDLPSGENRRCLEDALSALQAEWIDEHRVLLLARASVQDDLQILEVQVGARLRARPREQRNLSSPAISPNGRWLVYVPLDRTASAVGPGFAAQASPRLEALRLDRPGPPVPLLPALPGRVGQPAFSLDGHLYFVQFFSDSNEDGSIDAGDRGVLFRVTFPEERDDAPALAAAAMPE
jgi:cellulose synthase operon protein C